MEEVQSHWQVAGIAHFCYLFSEAFHLPRISYDELENAFLNSIKCPLLFDAQSGTVFSCLEETDCIDIENRNVLVKVICSLLRGCTKKIIDYSNWEAVMVDVFENSSADENQTSPFRARKVSESGQIVHYKVTFDELSLYDKIKVVYTLCEMRFNREDRLDKVNEIEVDELRVEPLGHDSDGCLYWYFFGTRLYKENPKMIKKIEEKRAKIERLKELELRSASAKSKMLNKKQNQSSGSGKLSKPIDSEDSLTNTSLNGTLNGSILGDKSGKIPLPEITQEELNESWSVICKTEPDWTALAEKFKKSKSPNERSLSQLLIENFVPNIHEIYLRKEQEDRKRQLELLPKRNSSRLQIKRIQQEEEERIQRLKAEDQRRMKITNRNRHTYI